MQGLIKKNTFTQQWFLSNTILSGLISRITCDPTQLYF
jgi:hypothetical protein